MINHQEINYTPRSYHICKIIFKILQHNSSVTVLFPRIGSIQAVKINIRAIDVNIHILTDLQTARIVFIQGTQVAVTFCIVLIKAFFKPARIRDSRIRRILPNACIPV